MCREIRFSFPKRVYSKQFNCTFIVFRKEEANIWLETSKARDTKESKTGNKKDMKKGEGSKDHKDKAFIESKFENYFRFSVPVKSIKPHQVSTTDCSIQCRLMITRPNFH
jgi:hypothetical protein